jgi:hypothetical protein
MGMAQYIRVRPAGYLIFVARSPGHLDPAHRFAIAPADEPEAVVLDFVGPFGPDGTMSAGVGRHGSMKPGGRRVGEGERQSMTGYIAVERAGRESYGDGSSVRRAGPCQIRGIKVINSD